MQTLFTWAGLRDQFFSLPPATAELRLVPPNLDSWSMSPIITDLVEMQADSLVLSLDFKYHLPG